MSTDLRNFLNKTSLLFEEKAYLNCPGCKPCIDHLMKIGLLTQDGDLNNTPNPREDGVKGEVFKTKIQIGNMHWFVQVVYLPTWAPNWNAGPEQHGSQTSLGKYHSFVIGDYHFRIHVQERKERKDT